MPERVSKLEIRADDNATTVFDRVAQNVTTSLNRINSASSVLMQVSERIKDMNEMFGKGVKPIGEVSDGIGTLTTDFLALAAAGTTVLGNLKGIWDLLSKLTGLIPGGILAGKGITLGIPGAGAAAIGAGGVGAGLVAPATVAIAAAIRARQGIFDNAALVDAQSRRDGAAPTGDVAARLARENLLGRQEDKRKQRLLGILDEFGMTGGELGSPKYLEAQLRRGPESLLERMRDSMRLQWGGNKPEDQAEMDLRRMSGFDNQSDDVQTKQIAAARMYAKEKRESLEHQQKETELQERQAKLLEDMTKKASDLRAANMSPRQQREQQEAGLFWDALHGGLSGVQFDMNREALRKKQNLDPSRNRSDITPYDPTSPGNNTLEGRFITFGSGPVGVAQTQLEEMKKQTVIMAEQKRRLDEIAEQKNEPLVRGSW